MLLSPSSFIASPLHLNSVVILVVIVVMLSAGSEKYSHVKYWLEVDPLEIHIAAVDGNVFDPWIP